MSGENTNFIDVVSERIKFDLDKLGSNELQKIEVDSFNLSDFWAQFGAAVQGLSNEVTKIGFACGQQPYPTSGVMVAMLQDLVQCYSVMRDLYLVLPEEVGATVYNAVTSAVVDIVAALLAIVRSLSDPSKKGAKERLKLTGTFWEACAAVETLPRNNLLATLGVIDEEIGMAVDAQEELTTVNKANQNSVSTQFDSVTIPDVILNTTFIKNPNLYKFNESGQDIFSSFPLVEHDINGVSAMQSIICNVDPLLVDTNDRPVVVADPSEAHRNYCFRPDVVPEIEEVYLKNRNTLQAVQNFQLQSEGKVREERSQVLKLSRTKPLSESFVSEYNASTANNPIDVVNEKDMRESHNVLSLEEIVDLKLWEFRNKAAEIGEKKTKLYSLSTEKANDKLRENRTFSKLCNNSADILRLQYKINSKSRQYQRMRENFKRGLTTLRRHNQMKELKMEIKELTDLKESLSEKSTMFNFIASGSNEAFDSNSKTTECSVKCYNDTDLVRTKDNFYLSKCSQNSFTLLNKKSRQQKCSVAVADDNYANLKRWVETQVANNRPATLLVLQSEINERSKYLRRLKDNLNNRFTTPYKQKQILNLSKTIRELLSIKQIFNSDSPQFYPTELGREFKLGESETEENYKNLSSNSTHFLEDQTVAIQNPVNDIDIIVRLDCTPYSYRETDHSLIPEPMNIFVAAGGRQISKGWKRRFHFESSCHYQSNTHI